MAYRFLDHTGDTAIEIVAASDAELLRDAARALASVIVDTARAAPRPLEDVRIELEAEDGESLLVDFLNELIFLFDSRGFLPWDLDAEELDLGAPARLRAAVRGEPYDAARHAFQTEVKAATFHGVKLRRTPGKISTTVVLDL
jgi:SHS2 domain-containing protein